MYGGDGYEGRVEPSSGLMMCETVNSVGQINFTFVREFSKPLAVATMSLSSSPHDLKWLN